MSSVAGAQGEGEEDGLTGELLAWLFLGASHSSRSVSWWSFFLAARDGVGLLQDQIPLWRPLICKGVAGGSITTIHPVYSDKKKASPNPSASVSMRQKTACGGRFSFPTRLGLEHFIQARQVLRSRDEAILCVAPAFTFKVRVLPTLRPGSFEIPWPEFPSGGTWQLFPRSPLEGT